MKRHNLTLEQLVAALQQGRGKPDAAAAILGVNDMAIRRAMLRHGVTIEIERRVVVQDGWRNRSSSKRGGHRDYDAQTQRVT